MNSALEWLINKFIWPDALVDGIKDHNAIEHITKNIASKATLVAITRVLFRLFCSALFLPISCVLYFKNYRVIYGCKLKQIGEIPLLDCQIKFDLLQKKTYKYLSFFSEQIHDNPYLLGLYSHKVIYIESKLGKILLSPVFNSIILWKNIRRFDASGNNNLMNRVQRLYNKKYNNPLISMPLADINYCKRKYFDSTENSTNKDFISIHVRTTSFDGGHNRVTRCANIFDYLDVIKYVINQGIIVVRLGDDGMPKLKELDGCNHYIEGTAIRDKIFDIYCLSQCKFHIGTASGPSDIPALFGVNTVTTNIFPPFNGLRSIEGDLCIFKKIVDNNNIIKNIELINSDINLNISYKKDLEKYGLKIIDNSPEEIIEVVMDFMGGRSRMENNRGSNIIKSLLSKRYRDYRAVGNYSEGFLNKIWNSN